MHENVKGDDRIETAVSERQMRAAGYQEGDMDLRARLDEKTGIDIEAKVVPRPLQPFRSSTPTYADLENVFRFSLAYKDLELGELSSLERARGRRIPPLCGLCRKMLPPESRHVRAASRFDARTLPKGRIYGSLVASGPISVRDVWDPAGMGTAASYRFDLGGARQDQVLARRAGR